MRYFETIRISVTELQLSQVTGLKTKATLKEKTPCYSYHLFNNTSVVAMGSFTKAKDN